MLDMEFIQLNDKNDKFAAILPPLCFALTTAERVGFEIGETAVVLGDGICADFLCLALKWSGASPCIRITGRTRDKIPGVQSFPADPGPLMDGLPALKATFHRRPGLALFDADGSPETLELLLEHLPPWARVVLAGNAERKMNLDYYNDIHRKGVSLLFLDGASDLLTLIRKNDRNLKRALRILISGNVLSDLAAVIADV